MMRWAALLLLVGGAAAPLEAELPGWLESWLFNPGERTRAGLDAYQDQKPQEAVPFFEVARRMVPDDPQVGFNSGTTRLGAGGSAAQAAEILQQAASAAGPALAPVAFYNLGNARLLAGNPAAAVDAFTQSLRLEPDHADAKFNLELALRQLQESATSPPQSPRQEGGESGDRPQPQGGGPGEQGRQSDAEQPLPTPPSPRQGEEQGDQQAQPQAPRALPHFRDQLDMTAEQAARILEAVENLERNQRRAEASQRARSHRGKDW
jgi:tetratricopeptide (TPR) repeat protein